MSTTQALSVAISAGGLTKLFDALVVSGASFANHLNGVALGDQNLPIGDIADTNISNYDLQLTTGVISNPSASLLSVAQVAPGSNQFSLAFSVDLTVTYQQWTESAEIFQRGFGSGYGPNNCGRFTFTANGVTLTATVQIVKGPTGWTICFFSASSYAGNAQINFSYPAASIFSWPQYSNSGSCGGQTIASQLEPELGTIRYASAIETALTPILRHLAESGHLTPDIAFQWTPNTFQFPSTATGLQAGVTGAVVYDRNPYPTGGTPPHVALPAIVESSDVRFYASDQLFSALYWAYTQAGRLSRTITPGMTRQPDMLQTNFFRTSVPGLYDRYPNSVIQVGVAPKTAPVVQFIPGWELPPPYILTPNALQALSSELPAADIAELKPFVDSSYTNLPQFYVELLPRLSDGQKYGPLVVSAMTTATVGLASQLPSFIYDVLLDMAATPHASEEGFMDALGTTIGSGNAAKYGAQILTVAATAFAQITHSTTCTYQVIWKGAPVTVFTIGIDEVDELKSFGLGVSGAAQTVQCRYQIKGVPTATLISSTIPDLNPADFAPVWQFALAPAYASTMQQVAAVGVPVPWIRGYTLRQASMSLHPGYCDVKANVMFPGGILA